jgi:hypothetical protein
MPSTTAGKTDAKGYALMIRNASRHTDKTLPCSSAHTSTFIVLPVSAASPAEETPALLVSSTSPNAFCSVTRLPSAGSRKLTTAQSAALRSHPRVPSPLPTTGGPSLGAPVGLLAALALVGSGMIAVFVRRSSA